MGEGISGSRMEYSRNMAEGIILGSSHQFDEVFGWAVGPEQGAVGKNGKDNGIIDFLPVGEVKAADRVTQDVKCLNGGVRPIGHDFDMRFPAQSLMKEDAKVSNEGGTGNRKFPVCSVV